MRRFGERLSASVTATTAGRDRDRILAHNQLHKIGVEKGLRCSQRRLEAIQFLLAGKLAADVVTIQSPTALLM